MFMKDKYDVEQTESQSIAEVFAAFYEQLYTSTGSQTQSRVGALRGTGSPFTLDELQKEVFENDEEQQGQ